MHLKTLTLKGFKSFAATVNISLERGITCVVGPNGSGKSNVVDALAWVMGEQGAKNLRGGQMSDVIFAGTSTRPPLGRAEVSLTIDNSDAHLDIEYSEVTISRTMFRTGGSEYAINGTPARLLDVQELLSDTGMGRQMHVIVGQGQLDQVLGASQWERRAFIEEAAGVLKHRQRKEKALRKIESLGTNLNRVQDLTNEVGRQLGPLARQAAAARKAQMIQATVRDATARLLAAQVSELIDKQSNQNNTQKNVEEQLGDLGKQLAQINERLEIVQEQFDQANPQLENLTRQWQQLTRLAERLSSLKAVSAERVHALENTVKNPEQFDTSVLEKRLEQAKKQVTLLQSEMLNRQKVMENAKEASKQAQEAENKARARIEKHQKSQADRREILQQLRSSFKRAQDMVIEGQKRLDSLLEELSNSKERLSNAQKLADQLQDESALDQCQDLTQLHQQASVKTEKIREELEQLQDNERLWSKEYATWQARAQTLLSTLKPVDATAEVMKAELPGILDLLPGRISVRDGWQDAVAALFGPWAQAVVAKDLDSAIQVVDFVKYNSTNSKKRAQVHVVVAEEKTQETVKASRVIDQSQKEFELPKGSFWASEIVQPRGMKDLDRGITQILEDCAVCEDLQQGNELIKTGLIRLVATKNGDLLSVTRVFSGGQDGASVLARQSAYDQAVCEAEAAGQAAQNAADALKAKRADWEEAKQAQDQALEQLRIQDAAAAEQASKVAAAKSSLNAAQAETQRFEKQIEKAKSEQESRQKTVENARKELDNRLEELETESEQFTDPREELEPLIAERNSTQEAYATAQVDLRVFEEKLRTAQNRAESLERNLAAEKRAQETAKRAYERAQRRIKIATRVNEESSVGVQFAQGLIKRLQTAREVARESNQQVQAQMSQLRAQVEELTLKRSTLQDASTRDQLAMMETQMRLDQLLEQAKEQIGVDKDTLLADFGPHTLVPVFDKDAQVIDTVPFVRAEQEKRLSKAKTELTRLGKVNPLALAEHETLQARHQFLVEQLQDLKNSRSDLLKVVDEVDKQIRQVFAQAFEDVQKAFSEVFKMLFPGGEGKLTLDDPDNLLESGVEISARPAGKKVKRLTLLSGGERSLAALAFLVAIFKARPSPFYVLDEVEAALDDTNLTRLLGVFEYLKKDSQLIIVTHHKRTMEIADALYGVTMKDGVTTVISQRLENKRDK